ncbi:xylanase inhibitor protein 1-like [Panicum miliaceum]|uniref:Xylanase inhibitor protein 1-like n=1 Tax=Panicum miliaceum TaxID=4540 RepID=A0A3L6T777_PANMI|nr:xylanase inhibitor protein 1-like [Panicum miliaceum]
MRSSTASTSSSTRARWTTTTCWPRGCGATTSSSAPGRRWSCRRRRGAGTRTTGVVTHINVSFYSDGYCTAYWQLEWDKWTRRRTPTPAGIYVGLPASEQVVGYVHPNPRTSNDGIIPVVQKAANYGEQTNYSSYDIQWA